MNKRHAVYAASMACAVLASGCAPASKEQSASFQNYLDRQAIETTLVRYSTGLDTFDADVYASAFTEDAQFEMEDKTYRGREEIRTIITGMKEDREKRAADADASNDPPPNMHHIMTNAVIDITSADTARHHSYWMTVNGGPQMYNFRVAAIGAYVDELVKRDGQWLIHRRKITQ